MEDFQSMKHLNLEPIPPPLPSDFLLQIFTKQKILMTQYKWHDGKTQEEITKEFAQAIASEAQELMNNCNWKPWKQERKDFDRTETIYEYIDILHFVINGLIALNVGPIECQQHYLAKNKENHERIKRNY